MRALLWLNDRRCAATAWHRARRAFYRHGGRHWLKPAERHRLTGTAKRKTP